MELKQVVSSDGISHVVLRYALNWLGMEHYLVLTLFFNGVRSHFYISCKISHEEIHSRQNRERIAYSERKAHESETKISRQNIILKFRYHMYMTSFFSFSLVYHLVCNCSVPAKVEHKEKWHICLFRCKKVLKWLICRYGDKKCWIFLSSMWFCIYAC